MKLRCLTKRGKTRKDRAEALKAEKKDLEAQLKSTKVLRVFSCSVGYEQVVSFLYGM